MSRMYDIIQELCRRDGTDVTKMCRALKIPFIAASRFSRLRSKMRFQRIFEVFYSMSIR